MHYLTSRNILHRDLAARNILLCTNNVVKICDFGLGRHMTSKGYYRKRGEEKVPLKWLALESLIEPIYTVYSDVWSFGIVLWELFSLGAEPYPGIVANTFDELKTHLQDGHRMSKPDYATHSIYDVMYSCWNIDPNSRPLFDRLAKTFSDLMKPDDLEEFNHLNKTFENSIAQKYKSEENEENEENDESPQSCLCCTSRFFRSHKNLNESTECLVNITLLPIDNAN